MPKCADCGHIDPEHGFTGPCEADWGHCRCKKFVDPQTVPPKESPTNVVPIRGYGYDGQFDHADDQREYDFRTWETDRMESHGKKAAYFAGWRDATAFCKRTIPREGDTDG